MADFLSVGIDASDAQRGAQEFARATDKISNSAEEVQREIDRTQRKMNEFSAIRIKDPGFANSLKNLDRDFEKKIKDIDRQLSILENGGTKAAKGLDTFEQSSRRAYSASGQFIEQIAQGDIGGVFGEIAQAGGPAGAAIVGVGLAFAGTAIAIGALTAKTIELVRETDKLAKDSRLTATQIQGLQVVANLTGESIDDLAENYKKLGRDAKRFEEIVKASGAAIDTDLRAKTQDASLAWEEMKIVATGALNAIAREGLPAVAEALREINRLIAAVDWSALGRGISTAIRGIISALDQLRNDPIMKYLLLIAGPGAAIGRAAVGAGNAEVLRNSKAQGAPSRNALLQEGNIGGVGFPNVPSLKKVGGGGANDAAQEAKRLFDAQIQLERVQSQILLDVEKQRIAEQRDLIQGEYEDKRILARAYFAERILLQQQETRAEVRHQEELLAIIERQKANAKKPSEKLAFDDDLAKVRAEISKLSNEGARATESIKRDASNINRGIFKEYAAALRELSLTYQELSEGSLSTATERFKDQHKAIYDLMKVVSPQQAQSLRDLLALISGQDTKRRDIGEAGRRFDIGRESLALEEDKINRDVDKRVISEERGLQLLKDARKRYRDVLLQELDTKIALLETIPGMELEVIQLERQKVAVEQLGTGFTKLQERIHQFADDAKNVLQDAFYNGIVEGPRAFFKTLLDGFAHLLAQLASELLTSQFVKLLGSLGQSGGGASGGGGGFLSGLLKIAGSVIGSLFGGAIGGVGGGGTGAFGGSLAGAGAGFASGTDYVSKSGFYNVGELGMERVFLPRGAYVQDNYDMRMASGGGSPINVVVNVNGVQNPAQFAQSKSQIGGQVAQALAAAQANR